MKITCPKCQASLKVIDAEPGAPQTCPRCQARFLAPQASSGAAAPNAARPGRTSTTTDDSEDWFDAPGPALPPKPAPAPVAPPSPPLAAPTKPAAAPAGPVTPNSPKPSPPKPASAPVVAPPPPPRAPTTGKPAAPSTAPPKPLATTSASTPSPASPVRTPLPPLAFDSAPEPAAPTATPPSAGARTPNGGGTPNGATVDKIELEEEGEEEPLALAAEADQYRFGHSCPLCGTRMDFVSSQIGTTTACPDCFTTFTIPTPSPHQERRPLSQDGFGAPDRLNMEAPAASSHRLDSPDALKSSADRLLEQAAKQLAEEQRDKHEGRFSDAAATSLFQFLIAPSTLIRYALLTAFGALAFAILANAPAALQEGGEGMKAAIWFLVASPLLIAWFAALSAHSLALLRETSAQVGPVEAWPSGNPFEWLSELIHLGLAMLVAGLPGFILATLLSSVGLGGLLVGAAVPLSIIVLLPLVLLSMLHEQSLFAVFSRDIFAGLTSFRSEVLTFYQASALLGIIVWMTLIGSGLGIWLLAAPQAAILTLAAFLYFRLLGWLARALLNEEE